MAGEISTYHPSIISKSSKNDKYEDVSSSINDDKEIQENRLSDMLIGSVRNLETENPQFFDDEGDNHCYNAWLSDTSRSGSMMTGDGVNPLQNFLISQMAVL